MNNLYKMNRIIHQIGCLLLTLCCAATLLQAQVGTDEYSWECDYERVEKLLEKSSYYNAVQYIDKVIEAQPNEPKYLLLRAETYRKARDYNRAAQDYAALLNEPGIDSILLADSITEAPFIRYRYAQMLKQDGRCMEAKDEFSRFAAAYSGADAADYQDRVSREIAGCDLFLQGPLATDYTVTQDVDSLQKAINSGYTEYAPMPTFDNYIIYSSLRSDKYIYPEREGSEKSKIYQARKENGEWIYETPLAGPFNEDGIHVGHGSYNKDRNRFYYTKCEDLANNLVNCRIFVSTLAQGEWSAGVDLGLEVNTADGESTAPFVMDNDGEERIYFSSNRDGTIGGMDLWYTTLRSDGGYTEAINLGRDINTIDNETTPYYHSDRLGTYLYFSSNGHPGFGGYDIFRSTPQGSSWGAPANLGHKINSGADEAYFVLNNEGTEGFLVSNRGGFSAVDNATCCDNIFNFAPTPPPPPVISLEGNVCDFDAFERPPLEGIEVKLFDVTDGNEILVGTDVSDPNFRFEDLKADRNYLLVIDQQGYIPVEKAISTMGIEEDEVITQEICVSKTGMTVNGTVYSDNGESVVLLPGATVTLYEVLPDGTLKEIESVISDANGNYSFFLPEGKNFRIIATKDCYLNTSTEDFTTIGLQGQTMVDRDIYMKLDAPIDYKIDNILYDFDEATLRPESLVELNDIIRIMNDNPDIIVEFSSHTDSKGSLSYNQRLSERRAQSVVDYLVSMGIPRVRMTAVGYGETRPIAPNTFPDGSDNPDGRQLNRRTEFRIISPSACFPDGKYDGRR